MKFILTENLSFNILNNIINNKIKQINSSLLMRYTRCKIEYVDEYEFDDHEDWVAVFVGDIQGDAHTFPIAINYPLIQNEIDVHNLDMRQTERIIEDSLWHEVGHGLYGLYEVNFLSDTDEEDIVEEFAMYQSGVCEYSELMDIIFNTLEENEK